MMNRRAIFGALALVTCIGLSSCHRGPADLSTAPLAGARIGGPFSLINQDGKRVTDHDYSGKFRIMYFGYTFCPDACPTDVQHLMAGFKKFEHDDADDAAKLQPIFISIDPARDTPAKVKAFVNAFHPRLIGLTGTEAEVAAVAKEYASVSQKQAPGPNGQYLVDHSRTAILFGPKGEPIMILSQDGPPAKIADELATWVR
jgi:protein SCO1/2